MTVRTMQIEDYEGVHELWMTIKRIRDPKYRRFERGRRAFFETESDNQCSGGDGREDRGKYLCGQ